MNERRDFLRLLASGSAGVLLVPGLAETGGKAIAAEAEAECAATAVGRLPENLIYSKEHPGVWKGKDGSHVPTVDVKTSPDGVTLNVENKHGMTEKHYIVRHTVVSESGQVLGAKTFHWNDKPVSTHEFKLEATGKEQHLFVLSFCNLHDLWIAHVTLKA